MTTDREVTQEERGAMFSEGVFDINGNMPFHPGYTGVHRTADGKFWDRRFRPATEITDPYMVAVCEWVVDGRNGDPPPDPSEVHRLSWWARLTRFLFEIGVL